MTQTVGYERIVDGANAAEPRTARGGFFGKLRATTASNARARPGPLWWSFRFTAPGLFRDPEGDRPATLAEVGGPRWDGILRFKRRWDTPW